MEYIMKKYFVALASTMFITGAYAQTPNPMPGATQGTNTTLSASADKGDPKRDAGNEKHIKDLHAKLKITAAEETLWATVVTTMRANIKDIDAVVDKRESSIASATAIDDLNAYAAVAQAHANSVKKLSQAFAPLYAAMPDAQKKVADEVFVQRGNMSKKTAAN
jgi:hypothetical protein